MKNTKQNTKKGSQNGITLIALVVTIVVLLILAGVTLNFVLGQSGILQQAKNTKNVQQGADEKDKVALLLSDFAIERKVNKNANIVSYFESKDYEVEGPDSDGNYTVMKDNKQSKINPTTLKAISTTVVEASNRIDLIKKGKIMNRNYSFASGDTASSLTEKDGYVEYFACTSDQYSTGLSWQIANTDRIVSLHVKLSWPECNKTYCGGEFIGIGRTGAQRGRRSDTYADTSYGYQYLLGNDAGANSTISEYTIPISNVDETVQNFFVSFQTYWRTWGDTLWRKFHIYDLYLEK